MKIAQIMLAKDFGGAERSFVDICEVLQGMGHEVIAICETRSKARHILKNKNIRYFPVNVLSSWDPFALRTMKNILAEEQPQVVQAHLARGAKFVGKIANKLKIPSLVKTHNYINLKYYQHVHQLVPTTVDQENYLLASGVEAGRITRIPNFTRMPLVSA
ncbi:MAG: glycosyltransferase, partial [Pseudomonadota bacterium]